MSPLDLALLVTLWASVGGFAMSRDGEAGVVPAGRAAPVGRVLLFNAVGIPLATVVLVRLLGIEGGLATGLVVFGITSGGALGLVAVQVARGDGLVGLALVATLELSSVILVPVWTAILLGGAAPAPIAQVLTALAVYLLLPLLAGTAVRRTSPSTAARLGRPLRALSGVGLTVVIVAIVARDAALLGAALVSPVPIATLGILGAALAGGWLVAGGSRQLRLTAALVSAQRGSALALALTSVAFASQPDARVAVVVAGLLTIIVVDGLAVALGVRARADATEARQQPAGTATAS